MFPKVFKIPTTSTSRGFCAHESFQAGTLTQAEQYSFRMAGVLAEATAQDRDSSLIPCNLQLGNSPAQDLPDELLIAIGITALGVTETGGIDGGLSHGA